MTPAGVLTILYSFSNVDGSGPTALLLGTNGNFYGTTTSGGAHTYGEVYELCVRHFKLETLRRRPVQATAPPSARGQSLTKPLGSQRIL